MKRNICVAAVMLALAVAAPLVACAQEAQPPAEDVTPDPWPKTSNVGGAQYSFYQPQLDSWDGYLLKAHAAVSVREAGAPEPVFGMIEFSAYTLVDRVGRTVHLQDFTLQKLLFPSAPAAADTYRQGFVAMAPPQGRTISLDRLEAMLAVEGAEKKARAVPVKNEPPKFVFSQTPAILIPVDGKPVWGQVPEASLERLINTRALVLLDGATNTFYLHLFDGFVTARSLEGPWTASK